jgi:hypothetical protein
LHVDFLLTSSLKYLGLFLHLDCNLLVQNLILDVHLHRLPKTSGK